MSVFSRTNLNIEENNSNKKELEISIENLPKTSSATSYTSSSSCLASIKQQLTLRNFNEMVIDKFVHLKNRRAEFLYKGRPGEEN